MTEKQLRISVILPVKNGDPALLDRAVQSVLSQTWPLFELLLIDDGSEEAFARKLDSIAESDERIRVLHIPGSGVSVARNLAVKECTGEIITYLDYDDCFHPCCFEEVVCLFSDPEIDALWGGTCFLNEEELTAALKEQAAAKPLTKKELEPLMVRLTAERIHQTRAECIGEPFRFENGGYINRGIASRFIRKEAFNKGGCLFPPGLKLCEDTIWNLEMMTQLRICYVKRIWYDYYDNQASASNRFHSDILEGMEQALEHIRGILDLSDDVEYEAYTRFLMDCLRYVHRCFYGHEAWNPTKEERKRVRDHIYSSEPWNEIASARYRNAASSRDRRKSLLYRQRLLLKVWGK